MAVDIRPMNDDAESSIQPYAWGMTSEADARSAHCDHRACALSWSSWQRGVWNLFMGSSESGPAAEAEKDRLAAKPAKVDHRSLVEQDASTADDSSAAASGASWHPFGGTEEARISSRMSEIPQGDKVRPISVPASLKMERSYFKAETGIYVPAIRSDNFKENESSENIRAAPITSQLAPRSSELYRDIPRKPPSDVSERDGSATEDLGSGGLLTSARALFATATAAMHKKKSPGTMIALGEQIIEEGSVVSLGTLIGNESLLSSDLFLSDIESTFAIALSDLSQADVGCTLQIASVQSATPLLSAVISSESRIDIHLPGNQGGAVRCSVEAPTQTGQPFIIYDPHGKAFAQLQAYNAGSAEVTMNDATVMIAQSVQGPEFGLKSPGGKPIGISRVQSDAVRGDQLEIRSLPGTDNLLVLVVVLTLTLFCQPHTSVLNLASLQAA